MATRTASTNPPAKAAKAKAPAAKKKAPAKKETASSKAGVALSAKEAAALRALDAEHAALPDHPVATILDEARELLVAARSKAADLIGASKLKAGFDHELHAARDMLERAEAVWSVARTKSASSQLKTARKAAESLKSDVMAALRYFLSDDEDVIARVDEIAEGTGDDDTISDLRKLAALANEHAATLKKAKKLPPKLVSELNKRADTLSSLVAEAAGDKHAATEAGDEAIDLRNRAYWTLRTRMEAVRDAGRYVFNGDKRALKHFRSSTTRYRKRKSALKPAKV